MENTKSTFQRSLESGISGATAMSINIATLMWLRTSVNYQYRHGVDMKTAFRTLYKEGGIPRFYKGVGPALLQGPLSRFGDTFANTGVISTLNSYESTKSLPTWSKSILASIGAASFRIFLMPIDTLKTTMQVQGSNGISNLKMKFHKNGPSVLYHGSIASAGATFVGHYPWFATFNSLQEIIPKGDSTISNLGRNAFIGFTSTCISDTLTNSIRVVKVYKQSSVDTISYINAAKNIIHEKGIGSLFGRGLKTKLLSNGIQGIMFSVLWKYIDKKIFKNS